MSEDTELRIAHAGSFTSDDTGLLIYEGKRDDGTSLTIARRPGETENDFIRRVFQELGWKVSW